MDTSTTLSPRRARKRAARIDRILEAATAVLSREGIEALTLKRLADDLDYTVGAFYRYFDSKEQLLAEVERRIIRQIGSKIRSALERTQALEPPLTPLFVLAEVYAALPRTMPEEFALIARNIATPGHVVPDEEETRVSETLVPLLKDAAQAFETAAEAGALAPGDGAERALVFWAGVHGAVQLSKLDRLQPPFVHAPRLPRRTTRTLLAGFGAPLVALDAAEEALDAWLRDHELLPRDEPPR